METYKGQPEIEKLYADILRSSETIKKRNTVSMSSRSPQTCCDCCHLNTYTLSRTRKIRSTGAVKKGEKWLILVREVLM